MVRGSRRSSSVFVEVARGLEKAQRPARRQRRPPEQLRHLAHERRAGPAPIRKYHVSGARARPCRRCGPRRPSVRPRARRRRACRRTARSPRLEISSGTPMSEPGPWPRCVFQSWRIVPEAVEPAAALPETVEVLLAREREAHAGAAAPRARPLPHQPQGWCRSAAAGRVGERQPHRRRRDLDAQARSWPAAPARRRRPRTAPPASRAGRRATASPPARRRLERHADDARAADADPGGAEVQRRALAREARHAVVSQRTPGPRRLTTRSGACAPVSAHRSGTGTPAPA